MKVTTLQEDSIRDIGHAFGYYAKGGSSLNQRLDKAGKPYIYVGMVCVREPYQGQGYMRKVLTSCRAVGIGPTQGNTAQVNAGIVRLTKPAGASRVGSQGSAIRYSKVSLPISASMLMPYVPITTAPLPAAKCACQNCGTCAFAFS